MMVVFGWIVVSDYGYLYWIGWMIGVCCVWDKWVVEFWDGIVFYVNVDFFVVVVWFYCEFVVEVDFNVIGVDIDRVD